MTNYVVTADCAKQCNAGKYRENFHAKFRKIGET
jgi:hypothetical protein